ncbi:MAG: pyruvate carboxylase subunit B [Firmicutes bacterium]|nr:pyruvate carboxylase subunit B [Bacillota bacterium]
MEKLKITDTTMRDGHQSLWATRMMTEDMLPILEEVDKVGYHSLEVWGGATFDTCIRFLDEDPWERLRTIRKHVKNTKLQMLLRGQNLVGYANYPDDVVERFVIKAAENGIDIFRIFDALNDVRNLQKSMQVAKSTGAHIQASVSYTVSPVHTLEKYVEMSLKLQDMGADSICIKDMAGLLSPYVAFDLVSELKKQLSIPIQVHTHYTGGMAIATYLKSAEAGADVVDTASVPLAFGTSQPPVETLVRLMQEGPRDTGLDLHRLFEIADYFEEVRIRRGHERGVTRINHMRVFEHQIPGGMISNFVEQLKEQGAINRMQEFLDEVPKVREELGYPPLVTPTSQIVGTQAVMNVLSGARYRMVPNEVKKYVQGYYGLAPGKIDEDIKKKILGKLKEIDCRPADMLAPRMEEAKKEIGDLARSEEDVLSYALFPAVAKAFFEKRLEKEQAAKQPEE